MKGEFRQRASTITFRDAEGAVMKTLRTAVVDKLDLRLVEKDGLFIGLVFASDRSEKARITGDDADEVWRRTHDEAGKANPKYFGLDGARRRFLHFFPNGFHSEGFDSQERNYKIAAKNLLDTQVPLEMAKSGKGFGESILAAYRATNLLSPYEKTWMQDVLRGASADSFIQAAASLASEEVKPALLELERILKPHNAAKWTIVTYLPFLWRPDIHMFLKPEVTKDFAARIGHGFARHYQARLSASVYEELIDMTQEIKEKLTSLKPRDHIDLQSFIWIVGDYNETTEKPAL